LIAKVSLPSHGVGYEIAFSLGLGKPVLALHQKQRKVSKMISRNPDPNLSLKSYQTLERQPCKSENSSIRINFVCEICH
jgi:hypothetical protein